MIPFPYVQQHFARDERWQGAHMHVRTFTGADFDPAAKLIAQAWYEGHGSHAIWHGADELCAHLARSDKGFVAEEAGAFLGVILLASPLVEDKNEDMRRHWLQQRTRTAAMASVFGVNAREGAQVIAEEDKLLDEVAGQSGSADVGEIPLLIVAVDARGKGIGGALLREGLAWLCERGASDVRLVTDDDCDWQLYEHLNMRRVGETVSHARPGMGIYAYQGSVADLLSHFSGERGDDCTVKEEELVVVATTDSGFEAKLAGMLDEHAMREGMGAQSYRYQAELGGRVVGGVSAWSMGAELHVDMLVVDEEARRKGVGAALLARVEEQARCDGCTLATVDTFSFQAPDYYPAHGYNEEFRHSLDDGTERIYFSKRL